MQNLEENSTNGWKYDEQTYERKDENYVPLSINVGGIKNSYYQLSAQDLSIHSCSRNDKHVADKHMQLSRVARSLNILA